MSNKSPLEKLRSTVVLDKKRGWIGGVCAGLANILRTDPAFVRVGAVIAAVFMPQLAIAAYAIAWILLTER